MAVAMSENEPKRTSERTERTEPPSLVVVELDEPQSPLAVKRLRKGKGKLYRHIGNIVKDLTEEGTVKAGAQPLVIVVQQTMGFPWAHDDDDD